MKANFFIFLFLVVFQSLIGQILIEPTIGFKAFDLSEYRFGGSCSAEEYQFNASFRNEHLTYGLNLGIQLNNSISLNLNGHFSNRIERICDRGIVGYSDLKFKNYSFAFLPKYQIRGFILGGGANLNWFTDLHIGKDYADIWGKLREDGHSQLGWIMSIGYIFNSVLLEFRYSDAKYLGEKEFGRYEKAESFECILAYRFKVKPSITKRSKEKCPKF